MPRTELQKKLKAEYNKQFRARNKEKRRADQIAWRKENRELHLLSKLRYRQRNEEKIAAYREANTSKSKEWRVRNLAKTMYLGARIRAKRKGVPFDLCVEDIIIPEICPILQIPLVSGDGGIARGSPSLDRIVPHLGYVKGNIQVISAKANTAKNDLSPEELLLMADWITRKFGQQ